MREVTLSGDQFILVLVLVKLGVMASLTSFLVRSRRFAGALFTSRRTVRTQAIIASGSGSRSSSEPPPVILDYQALDLSLEGLRGRARRGIHPGSWSRPGRRAGVRGRGVARAPGHGHVGVVAVSSARPPPRRVDLGVLAIPPSTSTRRSGAPFSAAPSIARRHRRHEPRPLPRPRRGERAPTELALQPGAGAPVDPHRGVAGVLSAIGIAIKVFNSERMETKLEDQARLLAQARYDALRSQINPHFLFNTLNSISSSIRTNSERAREMIVKLSAILRRALEPHETSCRCATNCSSLTTTSTSRRALRPHMLRVVKEIDPALLGVPVRPCSCQPLVENAIKHGIAASLTGGTIHIRAVRENGQLVLTIADDGSACPRSAPPRRSPAASASATCTSASAHVRPGHGLVLRSRPGQARGHDRDPDERRRSGGLTAPGARQRAAGARNGLTIGRG